MPVLTRAADPPRSPGCSGVEWSQDGAFSGGDLLVFTINKEKLLVFEIYWWVW